MRHESGVEDKLSLKGYCIMQCDSIQNDGYNCGVIALKVFETFRLANYLSHNMYVYNS